MENIQKLERVAKAICSSKPEGKLRLSQKFLKLLERMPDEPKANQKAVKIASEVRENLRSLYPDSALGFPAAQAASEISRFISQRKPGPETIVIC